MISRNELVRLALTAQTERVSRRHKLTIDAEVWAKKHKDSFDRKIKKSASEEKYSFRYEGDTFWHRDGVVHARFLALADLYRDEGLHAEVGTVPVYNRRRTYIIQENEFIMISWV
jgi:hypothetical protein